MMSLARTPAEIQNSGEKLKGDIVNGLDGEMGLNTGTLSRKRPRRLRTPCSQSPLLDLGRSESGLGPLNSALFPDETGGELDKASGLENNIEENIRSSFEIGVQNESDKG